MPFGNTVVAETNEKETTYLVNLKPEISFYSTSNNKHDNYVVLTEAELQEALELGVVDYYEPNYKVELHSENWNLQNIECDFSWKLGCYGNGVKIAVIDSGLQDFEEIEDNIIQGKNYLDETKGTEDNIGHGTFVTGIIASNSYGISHKSKIIPLKCFDKNTDTYIDDITPAIYDAVDVYKCDVINMSFGITSNSQKLEKAIAYALNNNVVVVASVGNQGRETLYYPAAYEGVIGVGSINNNAEISSFSQYNTSVDVVAPGEHLESLRIDGYAESAGTSFAAPHVTALAAIAHNVEDINGNKFLELLKNSVVDKGTEGYDNYYGYGIINYKNYIEEMIKNEKIFISPIDIEGEKYYATIYNNTQTDLDITCICANYIESRLSWCNMLPIALKSQNIYKFQNTLDTGQTKYMVWDNLKSLKPLAKSRNK